MKKIRIVLALMLMAGLFLTTQAQSQAIVDHEDSYWFFKNGPDELESYFHLTVTTPNGNMTIVMKFDVPEGHPLEAWIPEGDDVEIVTPHGQYLYGLWFEGERTVTSDGKIQYTLVHKKKWETI